MAMMAFVAISGIPVVPKVAIPEMAMMAKETVVVMSEILMAPKVAIPETAIIMTQKRNVIAAARTQRPPI